MAIQSSNIGSFSIQEAGKASDYKLGKAEIDTYVYNLKRRIDEGVLPYEEAVKARDFLGDLEDQYRYVLKHLDDYITDRDKLISKDGKDITEKS